MKGKYIIIILMIIFIVLSIITIVVRYESGYYKYLYGKFLNPVDGIGKIQKWDYKIYGECQRKFSNVSIYKIPKRKFYGDSYCNIRCLINKTLLTYKLDINVSRNQFIPAYGLDFNATGNDSCGYICHGKFIGFNC